VTGITMTLTQRERGYPEPVTHVGKPHSVQMETGEGRSQRGDSKSPQMRYSLFLKERRQDLKSILEELDFYKPDLDGLEVIGKGQPFTSVSTEPFACSIPSDKSETLVGVNLLVCPYMERELTRVLVVVPQTDLAVREGVAIVEEYLKKRLVKQPRVRTPERSPSPVDVTEEELFHWKNPEVIPMGLVLLPWVSGGWSAMVALAIRFVEERHSSFHYLPLPCYGSSIISIKW
uniref:Uncharacterized protein n=1 Tax=Calidris pygmaea TaxID=425635 RepID=A0A8C3K2C4_9CHAR